jgi:cobalamin biosynthesis Mg chelatase CobN
VACAFLAGLTHAGPAAAATPCWKTLLNDWYDGRIDQTYARHCYQDALKHLPADVKTYSSAHDDILRALQSATAAAKKSGGAVGPATPVSPPSSSTTSTSTTGTTTTTTTPTGRQPGKGLTGVADNLNTGDASSVPIPLLVLGGLAIALVAAGGIGLIAKRVQARKSGS